jgi:cell division protein FtsI (penicillin-binding protein 3)
MNQPPSQYPDPHHLSWHAHTAGAESAARGVVARARGRLHLIGLLFVLAFGAVILQLANITLLTDKEPVTGTASSTAIPGVRADITDRNGELLATSLPVMSVYADAARVIEPEKAADKIMSVLPNLNREQLLTGLTSKKRFVWIERALTPAQHAALHNLGLPGIQFQQEMRRVYPHANLFAHALGYLNVDGNGIAGLEKGLNNRLKTDPAPLALGVDLRLQHIMHRELQSAITEFSAIGGAGMIMDVTNGEILAFVSLPDFDVHSPGTAPDDARFNRLTLGIYEMGSTYKIFNHALALESGKVRLTDMFDVTKPLRFGRFTINDFEREEKPLDVTGIMVHSSNIGSVKMLQRVGIDAQKPFLARLGLTTQAPLELPERGTPMIPSPWGELNAYTISFGHGTAVSALHLVRAVAAVVNGGTLLEPTLQKRPDDEIIIGEKVLSRSVSDTMRRLMRLVVTDGTAKAANAAGYEVGGKTGTSEKLVNGRYKKDLRLSSFVGAFPMRDPRYAVFVMVDEPKPTKKTFGYATGGWVAAPVVGRVVAQMVPILGIPPAITPLAEKGGAGENKEGKNELKNSIRPEADTSELYKDEEYPNAPPQPVAPAAPASPTP